MLVHTVPKVEKESTHSFNCSELNRFVLIATASASYLAPEQSLPSLDIVAAAAAS